MQNRLRVVLGLVFLMALSTAGNTVLAADPVTTVLKGCQTEIETKCKDVTPGEGRLLACLYAYQDQLSGKCEYALYEAAVKLEQAVAALTHIANECADDIQKNCAKVRVGEGRILSCLAEHDSEVSQTCQQAIKDVGVQ